MPYVWVDAPRQSYTVTGSTTYVPSVSVNFVTGTTSTTWFPACPNDYRMNRLEPSAPFFEQSQYRLSRHDLDAMVPRPSRMPAPAILSARTKARDLLLSMLSDEQRRTLSEHRRFVVVGGTSGHRYELRALGFQGNVRRLSDNAGFCAHCEDNALPLDDHLIAQKLMIEHDEDAFLAIANRT